MQNLDDLGDSDLAQTFSALYHDLTGEFIEIKDWTRDEILIWINSHYDYCDVEQCYKPVIIWPKQLFSLQGVDNKLVI